MDWGRYLRALDARRRQNAERLRTQFLDNVIKESDIPERTWELIDEHDALMGDGGENGRA